MKTGFKSLFSLFALFLCMLILLLPMVAVAVGEGPGELPIPIEDMISPETGVWWSLVVVAIAIAVDTLLGILLGIKDKDFDFSKLPQFLMTGVLPYLGGLLILALLAHFIGVPFLGFFFTAAIFIAGKYMKDLVEKFKILFETAP